MNNLLPLTFSDQICKNLRKSTASFAGMTEILSPLITFVPVPVPVPVPEKTNILSSEAVE